MKQQIWGFVGSFVAGIVIGIVATFFAPKVVGPYLPGTLGSGVKGIEGQVSTKQRQGDRLILTILTPEGAILATFKKKVAEIDILVAKGDKVTLARKDYRAFLDDPGIGRVRKKESTPQQVQRTPLPVEPTEKDITKQVLQ